MFLRRDCGRAAARHATRVGDGCRPTQESALSGAGRHQAMQGRRLAANHPGGVLCLLHQVIDGHRIHASLRVNRLGIEQVNVKWKISFTRFVSCKAAP